jgi:hypothetical protein
MLLPGNLPMNPQGAWQTMQITVQVPEEVRLAAEARQIPVIDLVEELMMQGMEAVKARPAVLSAIERIRALRSPGLPGPR